MLVCLCISIHVLTLCYREHHDAGKTRHKYLIRRFHGLTNGNTMILIHLVASKCRGRFLCLLGLILCISACFGFWEEVILKRTATQTLENLHTSNTPMVRSVASNTNGLHLGFDEFAKRQTRHQKHSKLL